jgi:hypothetical protein
MGEGGETALRLNKPSFVGFFVQKKDSLEAL